MSIQVGLEKLREETARARTTPYLLTVADDGRPHSVAVDVDWDDGAIVVRCGGKTLRNVAARPLVSLLWPPAEAGGYSLIVDGDGSVRGDGDEARAVIRPGRAVLHRPGKGAPSPGKSCADDCVPVLR